MNTRIIAAALLSLVWTGCSAEQIDNEETEEIEETGEGQHEIVGGALASIGQFPWQARLVWAGQTVCGGSLIRKRWVLTAAHCVSGLSTGDVTVVLGDLRVDQFESSQQSRGVSRFIVHPGYDAATIANDVALVELSADATLSNAVSTIALQHGQTSFADHVVSGWGKISGGSASISTSLMHATLPVVPSAACEGAFGAGLFPSEICAGYSNGSKGACSGDSGGPLATLTTPPELAGIVSWGSGSCNTYSVFVRVSSFADWIESHVNRDWSPSYWTTQYADAGGWGMSESFWGTIQYPDLNGDGKQDVCGRSGLGLFCALSNGSSFDAPSLWTTQYGDIGWEASESYWGTIQYPDLNGDGKQDVCGRTAYGLFCALSNGSSFNAPSLWTTQYGNIGWETSESYWGTIEHPDLNGDGKQDVCGRTAYGLFCALSNGSSFNAPSLWTTQYGNIGWETSESYWGTIEYPDLNGDGKQDVCGRTTYGLFCALSNGSSFNAPSLWTNQYADAGGWAMSESFWGTIQYPDLNGDGKQDACGRSGLGLFCALSNGGSFNAPALWTTEYADAGGWAMSKSYWGTIQYPDLNGDGKQDACGRSGLGLLCALSNGSSFNAPARWTTGYGDAAGWSGAESYWGTIRYPDLDGDGKQDVCGRGIRRVVLRTLNRKSP